MTNEQLAQQVMTQQEQLGRMTSLLNTLSEANGAQAQILLDMQLQLQGFGATLQVFAEMVMAASPAVKRLVGVATSQMLARPEDITNETHQQLIQALQTAASSAPRTTPEGRRAGFKVVPGDESASEP